MSFGIESARRQRRLGWMQPTHCVDCGQYVGVIRLVAARGRVRVEDDDDQPLLDCACIPQPPDNPEPEYLGDGEVPAPTPDAIIGRRRRLDP